MLEMTMSWSGSEIIDLLKEDLRRRGYASDGHFAITLGEHPPMNLGASTVKVPVKYSGDKADQSSTCCKDKYNPYTRT